METGYTHLQAEKKVLDFLIILYIIDSGREFVFACGPVGYLSVDADFLATRTSRKLLYRFSINVLVIDD